MHADQLEAVTPKGEHNKGAQHAPLFLFRYLSRYLNQKYYAEDAIGRRCSKTLAAFFSRYDGQR